MLMQIICIASMKHHHKLIVFSILLLATNISCSDIRQKGSNSKNIKSETFQDMESHLSKPGIYFDRNLGKHYQAIATELQACLNFPSEKLFRHKIKEVYQVDITGKDSVLVPPYQKTKQTKTILEYEDIPLSIDISPEIAIVKYRYILPHYIEENLLLPKEEQTYLNPKAIQLICLYNKLIFYQEEGSYRFVKNKRPDLLRRLILNYGYYGNDEWLRYVVTNLWSDISSPISNDENYSHDLLFKYQCFSTDTEAVGDCEGIHRFRKNMLNQILALKLKLPESDLAQIVKEIMSHPNRYEGDKDKLLCQLYGALLQNPEYEYLAQALYDHEPNYKRRFKNYKYCNSKKLRLYSEKVYVPPEKRGDINLLYYGTIMIAMLEDPDGYVNLRQAKDPYAPTLDKISTEEKIKVLRQEDNWFLIQTKKGKIEYIHKSRIRPISNQGIKK